MIAILRKSLGFRSFCTQPASKLVNSLVSTLDAVDRESLDKLLTSVPQLTRYGPDQWHRTHQLMAAEGIEPEKFLSIVSTYPELLARDPDRLAASLHCWRSCQFGDRQMQALLAAHPQLLDLTDQGKLAARVAFLHSYFETRKNVWRLFLNCPNLVADAQGTIQPKVEYILQRMRIEVPEVVKSCALGAELDLVRCRHVFLERLGLFKPRSLKADPGDPNDNPKLHQITDTSDKRFAVKVAFVTLEEYEAFQELFAREGNRRDDVDGEDKELDDEELEVKRDDNSKARKMSYRKKSKRK
uniref:Putative transcription termination factor 4 mitochondrial n=1 Tax=Culex tarsalis TaxID=7177 RepID=A0A1Q3F9I2_CULTA